ncbi:MAG: lipid II:glycine glycyltransferase FemX [Limisphaerales bacterium]
MQNVELSPPQTPPIAGPEAPVVVNPLQYPAWDALLDARPDSSFFHGAAWARVLHETYGHRPVYVCRFASGRLRELLPIMEVSSPFTGRRGVSLPFTDFCEPLPAARGQPWALYELAMRQGRQRGWKHLECRGGAEGWKGASPSLAFYRHVIDLERGPEALFKGLDDAIRRGIRKAEREGLQIEFNNRLDSMRDFYQLHCGTRRRHGLPPQPFRFFANIGRHVLGPGQGFIATARLAQRPLAAAVFFHHGREALYKFGASDYAFQHLRPSNLMMWESVKRCAVNGFGRLDLGRTSLGNEGLRRFKLGFGAHEDRLEYYQYNFATGAFIKDIDRAEGWFNRVFRLMPLPLLRLAGELLYPHLS